MSAIGNIRKLTFRLISVCLFLSGLEELIRRDAAASNLAGFLLVLAGVAFAYASRAATADEQTTSAMPGTLPGNPVLARALYRRSGQIGMSVFVSGAVLSVLSAAILHWNIYSLVLFSGFGLITVGLPWMLFLIIRAAVETYRDATGDSGI